MTNHERNELLELMEGLRQRLKGDREASRQFLVDAGIYTKKGTLRKSYRNLMNDCKDRPTIQKITHD